MAAGRPRVFDSWALLALFEDEPSAGHVRSLLVEAQESHSALWISVVNLGEIWYTIARRYAGSEADASIQQILELGFEAEGVDWDMAKRAADFKARHRLSYADCFAAALAQQRRVELVTGDREFRPLEGEIRIHWL